MHVLRAEKGFIIVGQETDGTVTPDDLGLGWAIGKKKRDFVGKRGLARPDLIAPIASSWSACGPSIATSSWRKARRSLDGKS